MDDKQARKREKMGLKHWHWERGYSYDVKSASSWLGGELSTRLTLYVERLGVSKSALLRYIVERYLDKNGA